MTSTKSQSEKPSADIYPLFPGLVKELAVKSKRYKRIEQLIWSDHKARFIQEYLRYFVQITKHGAYIDGFPVRSMRTNSMPGQHPSFLQASLSG